MYCVGLRKDQFEGGLEGKTSSFKWAEKIPCPPISDFLDDWHSLDKPHIALQQSTTARKNIQRAEERIRAKGKDPRHEDVIVDCDASIKSNRQYHEFSPCVTKSRDRGHWITSRNRRFNKQEMFRLQGMNPSTFKVEVSNTVLVGRADRERDECKCH